jgi:hypothetical protein
MYRNPTFETKYNACGKIYLSDGATAGPVESKTLTCAGTGDFDGATLTTDKAGVFKLKVIQESYFGKFTFDLGGETVTMNVEKLLKPDELYDFGRFNCP